MEPSPDRTPPPVGDTTDLSGRAKRGAVAVLLRQNRLLVIRRSVDVVCPLAWCFPGGAIEPGESDEQALRREVYEEIGVRIGSVQHIWTSSVASRDVSLSWWSGYLGRSVRPVANPREVAEWRWVTLGELEKLPGLLESNRAFLAAWRQGTVTLPVEA